MSIEVTGKIIKLLPEQSGQSQRGPWKKQDMIIETNEQYPKKIAITCWGEKVDEIQQMTPGTGVKVAINIESREYNERWYTDVKAWKIDIEVGQPADNTNTGSFNAINEDAPADTVFSSDETEGDLPF